MHRFFLLGTFAIAVALVTLSAGCSKDVSADPTPASSIPSPDINNVKPTNTAAAVGSGDPTIASGSVLTGEPAYRDVTIPAGTRLLVRLDSNISSDGSRVEDPVDGTVTTSLRIADRLVLPEGTKVRGDVTAADPAGKVKGRARVAMRFHSITVDRKSYPIAAQVSRLAPETKRQDAQKIAIPAVGGAIVGAIVGGKKGAAIGAAAGGGAGTAVVLSTAGKEVSIPSGSVITLRLQQPVTVRVKT